VSDCTRWSFQQQIDWFRRQFAQHNQSAVFSQVLPASLVIVFLQSLDTSVLQLAFTARSRSCGCFSSQVIHANPTLP